MILPIRLEFLMFVILLWIDEFIENRKNKFTYM